MKPMNRYLSLLAIMLLSGLLCYSCTKDGGLTDPDTENPETPGNTVDADKLSEYLVLTDAQKITGDLPAAPDNQLKVNFKDSIWVVKDFPYGARVAVLHEGRFDITGFYVGVSNSSFYYDVPLVEAEAQDSTDVFYINMEIPESDDVEYPFAIPIKIVPYGPGLEPIDVVGRWIIIEDPEAFNSCSVLSATSYPKISWEWEFTVAINYAGEVFQIEAPGLKKVSAYQTGGCCNEDGSSSTVADDPYCFEKFSDGTPNPRWKSIDVEHYFMWLFDNLWLYEDGTFWHYNSSWQTDYVPSLSDFCALEAGYDDGGEDYFKRGTHDFTPGADYLNITYDVTDPPVFGKTIQSGEIQYTCHSLILTVGREEKWSIVFRKIIEEKNGDYLLPNWWD